MKKFHSRLLMALAITIAITLCGCSDPGMGEEEATVHVAIVAANTANANTLAVNHASVKDTLRESAYTHGHVSMVRCDGSPQVVFSTEIPTPKAKINQAKKDQLADEYTEDTGSASNGGLYENVMSGEMVEEFDAWLYDDARKAGDVEIVETADYGAHIMYYVGEGQPEWEVNVRSAITSEKYNSAYEALEAATEIKENAGALKRVD